MRAKDILKVQSVDTLDIAREILNTSGQDSTSYPDLNEPDGKEKIRFRYMNGEDLLSIPSTTGAGGLLAQIKYVLYGRLICDETLQPMVDSTIDWLCRTQFKKALDISLVIQRASQKKMEELNNEVLLAKNVSQPVLKPLS